MKVVIPDHIELSDEGRKKLENLPEITIYDDTVNDPSVIINRIKDAHVVTANYIDLTQEIIRNSPKLKYIISPAKGYEWIDVKEASKKKIKVLNCPTFNARAVAEHAFGLLLAVERHIVESHNAILKNKFPHPTGRELFGKTLLVIGYGEIGKKATGIAKGFGMKTSYANTKTKSSDVDRMIADADCIILCLPLNNKTQGLFGKSRLALMKKSAVFVNVARALIVDQKALYNALKINKIAGAGLDVFPDDATITKPTKLILDFAKLPNVVTTPHIGYKTEETAQRLGDELVANIKSCIKGKPINVVN